MSRLFGILLMLALMFFSGSGDDVVVSNMPCRDSTAALFREMLANFKDTDKTDDELLKRFNLSAEALNTEVGEGYRLFNWNYHANRYQLYIVEDEKPTGFVFFETSRPTLEQIVACLGEPEWYRSGYGPYAESWVFNLQLYFPAYGLVATSFQATRQRNIVINEHLTASDLRLAPSGTTQEVIASLYFHSPEGAQIAMEQLKPWPGSMEAMIDQIEGNLCRDYPTLCTGDEP